MKRFIFILTILLFANFNCAYAADSTKAEIKAIKNVLKSQIESANKYDYDAFLKHFDTQYINSDGFPLEIYSKLVQETWSSYSNIQYGQQIKHITITGNEAIAEVVETANASVNSQYDLKGNLKSIANNIYFLKKIDNNWKIVSDVILTEDTYLAFGEMVHHSPTLTVPYQALANQNYTATLEYIIPKETIAIASLNQEKVTFPQESAKENYRRLPDDGILERFFTANCDNTNEYIIASVGLTRPVFDNNDLEVKITGVAYIIKRVNIVPENKFIDKSALVPVNNATPKQEEVKDEAPEKEEVSADAKEEVVEVITPTIVEKPVPEAVKEPKKTFNIKDLFKREKKEQKEKQPKEKKVKQEKNNDSETSTEANLATKKELKQKVKKTKRIKEVKTETKNKTPKEKKIKQKKPKSTKGTFSPTPVDIPTTVTKKEVE